MQDAGTAHSWLYIIDAIIIIINCSNLNLTFGRSNKIVICNLQPQLTVNWIWYEICELLGTKCFWWALSKDTDAKQRFFDEKINICMHQVAGAKCTDRQKESIFLSLSLYFIICEKFTDFALPISITFSFQLIELQYRNSNCETVIRLHLCK